MNRQTRKQLKTDKFAQEVGQTFSFVGEHRSEIVRYGLIVVGVIILGGAYYFYSRSQAAKREDALTTAYKIDGASVGPGPATNGGVRFATKEEKEKARTQAFADLFANYRGTPEGSVGGIFIAAEKADGGDLKQAEKLYKDVADSAPKDYESVAQLSLAQVYAAEGKQKDAEGLLQDLVKHPTELVSSEQAKIALADVMAQSNPKEAAASIQPLATARTAISKAAISEMGRIQAMNPQP